MKTQIKLQQNGDVSLTYEDWNGDTITRVFGLNGSQVVELGLALYPHGRKVCYGLQHSGQTLTHDGDLLKTIRREWRVLKTKNGGF